MYIQRPKRTSNPNAKHNRISNKCETEDYAVGSAVSPHLFQLDAKTKHKRFFDHTGALCKQMRMKECGTENENETKKRNKTQNTKQISERRKYAETAKNTQRTICDQNTE